jgi:two-component system, chemotaxis family, protein-glutamate methylesterase/glutaminase
LLLRLLRAVLSAFFCAQISIVEHRVSQYNIQMQEKSKIRVLVADDSFFIRTYLSELLSREADIEVVGAAVNGSEVVDLARKFHPDVITMDYNMPSKNGLEASAEIMLGDRPLPAIIMLSAFSGEEGKRVWRSLEESGAHIIMKPSGEVSLDIDKVGRSIVEKIKDVGYAEMRVRELYERLRPSPVTRRVRTRRSRTKESPAGVVVVGASTGGPPLIERLLSLISPEEGYAFVIAQHMSAYFTELFAERLDRVTDFSVREASDGDTLEAGHVLVVPGGYSLLPRDETPPSGAEPAFSLEQISTAYTENGIDDAMRAVAHNYGRKAFGVLLPGVSSDGAKGLAAIRSHGGAALVQEPRTAAVAAMPEHALIAGAADDVAALEDIPEKIRAYFSGK